MGFDECLYPKALNYVCVTCDFKQLEVGPVAGPLKACQLNNQTSTITIHAGGGKKDIQIKRNPVHGIKIEFDDTEYGPDWTGLYRHQNAGNNITDVKVTPSQNCDCPTAPAKCLVRVTTTR
jgi:hypothetical protein